MSGVSVILVFCCVFSRFFRSFRFANLCQNTFRTVPDGKKVDAEKRSTKSSDRNISCSSHFRGATAKRTWTSAQASNFALDAPILSFVRTKIRKQIICALQNWRGSGLNLAILNYRHRITRPLWSTVAVLQPLKGPLKGPFKGLFQRAGIHPLLFNHQRDGYFKVLKTNLKNS